MANRYQIPKQELDSHRETLLGSATRQAFRGRESARVADAIEKDVHRMAKPADSGAEESKMDGWGDEGNKAVELTRIDKGVNDLIERVYSKSYGTMVV